LLRSLRSQAEIFVKLQQSSPDEVEALLLGMALEIVTVCDKVESKCRAHRRGVNDKNPRSNSSFALCSGGPSGAASGPAGGAGGIGGETCLPESSSRSDGSNLEQLFLAALRPLQLQLVSLDRVGHLFATEASRSSQGGAGGGASGHTYERNKRILKEVSSLASALPLHWDSSIHVAVDENRFDILR
jgi:hypothetical protein